jgi:hypothetical protein
MIFLVLMQMELLSCVNEFFFYIVIVFVESISSLPFPSTDVNLSSLIIYFYL